MGKVSICFDISCHSLPEAQGNFEKIYSSSFKKLSSFLYDNSKFGFSFYFSGLYFEWLEKKHKEFLVLLSELTSRKQIEILGGGFYDPLFPLIPPVDRIGQIEKLTTEIRKNVGKKPRGLKIPYSVWNPSLIASLKTCGIEYVLLDNSLIGQAQINNAQLTNLPYIIEELGKTITVIGENNYQFLNVDAGAEDFVKKVSNLAKKQNTAIVYVSLNVQQASELIENQWFENLWKLVKDSEIISLTTPQNYLKEVNFTTKANVSSLASSSLLQWASIPYTPNLKSIKNENIRSFLYTYPESYLLYSRMIYACMVNDQCRGDKVRKKFAREFIWAAQHYSNYIFDGSGGISNRIERQNAYKNLISAEKSTREVLKNIETCHSMDLDMDGLPEYIFKFIKYNSFVTTIGGMILELDVFHNQRNYADTMGRLKEFDGVTDLYPKKMFVDHIIEKDAFDSYKKDCANNIPVFANLVYSVNSFDRARKELQLVANGVYGKLDQPVFLRKKFIFNEDGLQVQYILKNASPLPLQGFFAVELNLAMTNNEENNQVIEVIASEAKEMACPNQTFIRQDNVSFARISDTTADVSFNFQLNENAGICLSPLNINRSFDKSLEEYQATNVSFFWNLDIAPGLEVEKTILMSIQTKDTSSVKRRKSKK